MNGIGVLRWNITIEEICLAASTESREGAATAGYRPIFFTKNRLTNPLLNIHYKMVDKFNNPSDYCLICLISEDLNIQSNCKQNFHLDCLNQWVDISKTCCYCRTDLTPFVFDYVFRDT